MSAPLSAGWPWQGRFSFLAVPLRLPFAALRALGAPERRSSITASPQSGRSSRAQLSGSAGREGSGWERGGAAQASSEAAGPFPFQRCGSPLPSPLSPVCRVCAIQKSPASAAIAHLVDRPRPRDSRSSLPCPALRVFTYPCDGAPPASLHPHSPHPLTLYNHSTFATASPVSAINRTPSRRSSSKPHSAVFNDEAAPALLRLRLLRLALIRRCSSSVSLVTDVALVGAQGSVQTDALCPVIDRLFNAAQQRSSRSASPPPPHRSLRLSSPHPLCSRSSPSLNLFSSYLPPLSSPPLCVSSSMALLDPPCAHLPFDRATQRSSSSKRQQLGASVDERETDNEDQPLTPTTPTTPTTPPSPASASHQHSHMTASSSAHNASHSSSSSTSASTPAAASTSPSHALSSPSSSPSPAHHPALPTVLQSVFSYIFTDHSSAQPSASPSPSTSSQLLSSALPFAATSTTSSSAVSPSTPSHSPSTSHHITSSPVTPLSPHSATGSSSPLSFSLPTSSPSSSAFPSASLPAKSTRHCAILDLDETLLHSFFPDKVTPYQYQHMVMRCQTQEQEEREGKLSAEQRTLYQVDVGDGTIVVLMLRPHLRPFLVSLFASYDVGVWSAGGKLYVDAICRVLFPSTSSFRPLFQLCWDDVQVETNGLSSYTKPLTTLIARFSQLSLHSLFLVDNRKENGLHFPTQLVIAPDYLPRPWEWNGEKDKDQYLLTDAMHSIGDCVEAMKGQQRVRVLIGDEQMEEEEEDESDMGLEDEEEGEEAEAAEEGREEEEEAEEEEEELLEGSSEMEREERAEVERVVYEQSSDDFLMEEEEQEEEERLQRQQRAMASASISSAILVTSHAHRQPPHPRSSHTAAVSRSNGRRPSQKATA